MAKKKIYTIANAHLDTIWSWDFETTVDKYIFNTLNDNFKLFEKYPSVDIGLLGFHANWKEEAFWAIPHTNE